MEQDHRNHKDAPWGWFGVLVVLLDGFPRARARSRRESTGSRRVVTPWSGRAPHGWSA